MRYKYLGVVSSKIANYYDLSLYENKPIVVFDDRIIHVRNNHLKDFESIENIEKSYERLSVIINNPDYVFYDEVKCGLEYYKYIDKYICVVVRIRFGKVLKVRSWYPVKYSKIVNRKKREKNKKSF